MLSNDSCVSDRSPSVEIEDGEDDDDEDEITHALADSGTEGMFIYRPIPRNRA